MKVVHYIFHPKPCLPQKIPSWWLFTIKLIIRIRVFGQMFTCDGCPLKRFFRNRVFGQKFPSDGCPLKRFIQNHVFRLRFPSEGCPSSQTLLRLQRMCHVSIEPRCFKNFFSRFNLCQTMINSCKNFIKPKIYLFTTDINWLCINKKYVLKKSVK